MACSGCGGNKTSNHAPKKTPNWGMNTKPAGMKKSSNNSNTNGGFGTPKVRMSFGGGRKGY